MVETRFAQYTGDAGGAYQDENHLAFRWLDKGSRIFFTCARRGNAMSIHYAHDAKSKKKIKRAVCEFIEFIYETFDWCEMIIGQIHKDRHGAKRLAKELGFDLVAVGSGEDKDFEVYARAKQ